MKKTTFYKVLTPEGNWGKTITCGTLKQVDKVLRKFGEEWMYVKRYVQTKSGLKLDWLRAMWWSKK